MAMQQGDGGRAVLVCLVVLHALLLVPALVPGALSPLPLAYVVHGVQIAYLCATLACWHAARDSVARLLLTGVLPFVLALSAALFVGVPLRIAADEQLSFMRYTMFGSGRHSVGSLYCSYSLLHVAPLLMLLIALMCGALRDLSPQLRRCAPLRLLAWQLLSFVAAIVLCAHIIGTPTTSRLVLYMAAFTLPVIAIALAAAVASDGGDEERDCRPRRAGSLLWLVLAGVVALQTASFVWLLASDLFHVNKFTYWNYTLQLVYHGSVLLIEALRWLHRNVTGNKCSAGAWRETHMLFGAYGFPLAFGVNAVVFVLIRIIVALNDWNLVQSTVFGLGRHGVGTVYLYDMLIHTLPMFFMLLVLLAGHRRQLWCFSRCGYDAGAQWWVGAPLLLLSAYSLLYSPVIEYPTALKAPACAAVLVGLVFVVQLTARRCVVVPRRLQLQQRFAAL